MRIKQPRILLTGKNGQIGADLASLLTHVSLLRSPGREEMDLSNPTSLRRCIRDFRPQIIINAAAYTAVDGAENDRCTAQAVNADAPLLMAQEAKEIGAALIHYSTDYVFDGAKREPYTESDPTNPINFYGETKLAGERGIQSVAGVHLIFRTTWVYATRGKNFLLTICRLASEREELRIVADQTGAPTWSRAVAKATAKILDGEWTRRTQQEPFAHCSGIYHMTASGQTTWYDFAKAIIDEARSTPRRPWLAKATNDRSIIAKRISPIGTSDYPTPAQRPAYSVLSNSLLQRTFGVRLPDWKTQLHAASQEGYDDGIIQAPVKPSSS